MPQELKEAIDRLHRSTKRLERFAEGDTPDLVRRLELANLRRIAVKADELKKAA